MSETSGDTEPIWISEMRSSARRQTRDEVRMQTIAKNVFIAFYVTSATFSQLTVCFLLNYLLAGASSG